MSDAQYPRARADQPPFDCEAWLFAKSQQALVNAE
jgi:hypothetical protein